MVNFERYTLSNGLRLLVHKDETTPMATVCMTYDVGTKDEDPEKSGYAHLLEHLMFCGSKNAARFDDLIQNAGGENNAFTNQDMTVFYDIVPLENLEVALFLEADRMTNLQFKKKSFLREQKVVVEEFKETCIDEPYGDIWHHIGPLLYQVHPYSIPPIGKKMEHIANARIEDLESFYKKFYQPANAILTVSGNIAPEIVLEKVQKWFGEIPNQIIEKRMLAQEPNQEVKRRLHVSADVPTPAIYLIFHSAERMSWDYYLDEVLSDILGEGDSSVIYKKLVKEQEIFSEADVYITGTLDTGLFILEGKLNEGKTFEEAEKALWSILNPLKKKKLSKKELTRLQNKIEHNLEFAEIGAFHKAVNLGYYELLGNPQWINEEGERYRTITINDLQERSKQLFQESKASVIYYNPK